MKDSEARTDIRILRKEVCVITKTRDTLDALLEYLGLEVSYEDWTRPKYVVGKKKKA
jgi:signal recognition particle subunit SEC65